MAAFLGDTDNWAQALYGDDPAMVVLPRWELDHFAAACLATVSRHTVAQSWRRCHQGIRTISVPEGVVAARSATKAILARNSRLVAEGAKERRLKRSVVAQLLLTAEGNDLDDVLFVDGWPSGVRGARDANYAIAVAHSLNCEHRLARELVDERHSGRSGRNGSISGRSAGASGV